ncbi:33278_t:CDS:2, partial [Racocetra persica]
HSNSEKINFVDAYNELKQYYLGSKIKQKLTENDKSITKVYFDLMKEIHNKLISTIGKYISETPKEELDEDNPLYSGIIDLENIKSQKPCLFQKISNLNEWKQLNEIGLPKQKIPFNQQNIKAWLKKNENKVERNGKQL